MVSLFLKIKYFIYVITFFILNLVPKTSSDSLITSQVGEDVILPCEMHHLKKPQLTWLLNGHEIDYKNNSNYITTNNSLSFNAKSTDTGIYQCLNDDEESKELVLVIYSAPTIYPINDEIIKVTSKSDLILKCDATGVPFVSVFVIIILVFLCFLFLLFFKFV